MYQWCIDKVFRARFGMAGEHVSDTRLFSACCARMPVRLPWMNAVARDHTTVGACYALQCVPVG